MSKPLQQQLQCCCIGTAETSRHDEGARAACPVAKHNQATTPSPAIQYAIVSQGEGPALKLLHTAIAANAAIASNTATGPRFAKRSIRPIAMTIEIARIMRNAA